MYKKKLIASATTAVLVTGMLAGTAMADELNENGATQTVTGESSAVQPIISVELPGDLTFAINPLRLDANDDGTKDEQIVATSYGIVNYSNVPVLVNAKTKAVATNNTNLLSGSTAVNYDANTDELTSAGGAKDVLLIQAFPEASKGVTWSNDTVTVKTKEFTKIADIAGAKAQGGLILSENENDVNFKLNAVSTNGEPAADGVSGFTFVGAVNPNATFDDGDITVSTTFTLTTLTTDQYQGGYKEPTILTDVHASIVEKK